MRIFFLFSLFIPSLLLGQQGLWRSHASYRNALDVGISHRTVVTGAPGGIFVWDDADNTLQAFSKVSGLTGQELTAMAVQPSSARSVLGFASGRINVVEGTRVITMIDLEQATSVGPSKRINRIFLQGDTAWMATDFGVVVADVKRYLILDSYTFGPGGTTLQVTDLALTSSTVYAATDQGIKAGNRSLNLKFPASWSDIAHPGTGTVQEIAWFNNGLVAAVQNTGPDDSVWVNGPSAWQPMPNASAGTYTDLHAEGSILVSVSTFNAVLLNSSFVFLKNVTPGFDIPDFVPYRATYDAQRDLFWIASNIGLVRNAGNFQNQVILPEGPVTNNVYALNASPNHIWVAPGGLTSGFTPSFNNDGVFSASFPNDWSHIPTSSLSDCRDVMQIVPFPNSNQRAFVLTYGKGIFEINGQAPIVRYTAQNTNGAIGNVPAAGDSVYWTGWGGFDLNGQFWALNNQANQPLIVRRKDGTWESFSLGTLGGPGVATGGLLATTGNQIWIRRINSGITVFEETETGQRTKSIGTTPGSGGLPSGTVLAMAEDLDGEIWIGTNQGLAVIFAPFNLFTNGTFDASRLLVNVNGTLEELLANESVTAIAVDGANRKWLGTQNNGLYLVSEDGREVIHQFTAQNSPLPSSNIVSLAVDPANGWVYIGTERGLVSYKGTATEGVLPMDQLEVYPNPLRPGDPGPISIRGFSPGAQVKITDAAGNLVYETVSDGGQVVWDGRSINGEPVRSGIYLVVGTNDTGTTTAMGKLAIVR